MKIRLLRGSVIATVFKKAVLVLSSIGGVVSVCAAQPTAAADGGLALPASYTGVLPCADCRGIVQTLTLRMDGHYQMRRLYLDRPDGPVSEAGHWHRDAEGRLILSRGTDVLYYVIENAQTLQQLDRAGHAIRSSLNYRLRRTAEVDVEDASITLSADPLKKTPREATATLTNTYWKLIELAGEKITLLPGQAREIRITLDAPGPRMHGFAGCNTLQGSYVSAKNQLGFNALSTTRMACPPPLMALEVELVQALGHTTGYALEGERLSLLSGERTLATFQAVYLQ